MKKKYVLFCFGLLCLNNSYSQEKEFKFTPEKFTDYVVTDVENKNQADLYKKTLDWISVTYKNPKEVIKSQIEDEYIRLEGSSDDIFCSKVMGLYNCNKGVYQIEISFKENKYKFDVIELKQLVPASKYSSGGWYDFNLDSNEAYYNKKGEIRNVNKLLSENLPTYFNSLNQSLRDFIISDNIPSKNSDW